MRNTIDRRHLLKISAFATASALLPVSIFTAASAATDSTASSHIGLGNGITRILACDDSLRLALATKGIPEDFGRALERNWDTARIGSVLKDTARLTSMFKTPATAATARKLAFALGAVAHLGVKRELYPGESGISERMVYHDAALLQYINGDTNEKSSDDIADLFATIDSRTFIRMHTLQPDVEDVDRWLMRLVAWNEGRPELHQNYAQTIATPEAGKVRKYIVDENFYNPSDEIIQLAAELRRGDAESMIDFSAARTNAYSQSLYARAIAAGYDNLLKAAEIYDGNSDYSFSS